MYLIPRSSKILKSSTFLLFSPSRFLGSKNCAIAFEENIRSLKNVRDKSLCVTTYSFAELGSVPSKGIYAVASNKKSLRFSFTIVSCMAHVIIRTAKSLEAGLCSTRCPVEESIILSSPFLNPTTIKFPIYVNDTKKVFQSSHVPS